MAQRRRGRPIHWIAGSAIAVVVAVGIGIAVQSSAGPGPGTMPPAPSDVVALPTSPIADSTSAPTEPLTDATAPATFDPEASDAVGRSPLPVVTIEPAPIPSGRIATRVVVPALRIDLPVTRQTTTYPACDVAMYLMELRQPGGGGVTYLYAHAQAGNFLPLYQESLVNDGARMRGMVVEVYTGDSLKFTYRITEVRRHVTSLDGAFAWQGESVFLQTSEGPSPSTPKLQVVATHVSTAAADHDAAHPQPRPVTCR